MAYATNAPPAETVDVSTTIEYVFGSSNWTVDDFPAGTNDMLVSLQNNGTTEVYALVAARGAGPLVSPTVCERVVYAGSCEAFLVKADQSLQVIRATGSGNVTARRYV